MPQIQDEDEKGDQSERPADCCVDVAQQYVGLGKLDVCTSSDNSDVYSS